MKKTNPTHTHTSTSSHSPALTAIGLVLAGSLALVGCGSSETDTTQTDAASTEQQVVDSASMEGQIFAPEDPWIRATESTMETSHDSSMSGAFVHLTNLTDEEQTIVGAQADIANVVELHEVVDDGGVNLMREKEGGFVVPAGTTYELNPSEDHIMLMELTEPILPGDTIEITLELASGETQVINFVAKEYVGAQENYGDMEGHDHSGHDHSSESGEATNA